MDHIVSGKKPAEISELSGMAIQTVDMHIARAKAKLGAKTSTQAAVLFDRLKRSIY